MESSEFRDQIVQTWDISFQSSTLPFPTLIAESSLL